MSCPCNNNNIGGRGGSGGSGGSGIGSGGSGVPSSLTNSGLFSGKICNKCLFFWIAIGVIVLLLLKRS